MGRICSLCGAERPDQVVKGDLLVMDTPPEAFWRGLKLQLTTRQARVLLLLAKRGALSDPAMDMIAAGPYAGHNTTRVFMSRLRAALRHTGIRIEHVEQWGYRLIMPEREA